MSRVARPSSSRGARLVSHALIGLVVLYQRTISPLLPSTCRFVPSCSSYARDAIAVHGPVRGLGLALRRVGRCHPWGGAGHDPVRSTRRTRATGGE